MKNRVVLLFFFSILQACSPQENVFMEYLSGARSYDIGVQGARADSLFANNISSQALSRAVVMVTDAKCSICISSAIDLYKSFQKAETEYSLIILLDGPDRETFDYYWFRESFPDQVKDARILLASRLEDLPKGIYVVEDNETQSFSLWTGR